MLRSFKIGIGYSFANLRYRRKLEVGLFEIFIPNGADIGTRRFLPIYFNLRIFSLKGNKKMEKNTKTDASNT
jgi:hypothetical protein